MKVTLEQAVALFTALTFHTAHKWDAERFNKRFREIGSVIEDPENYPPDDIKDKKTRDLYDRVKTAYEAEDEITIDEEAVAPKGKKKKKAVADDEDEADVAVAVADDEDEAEETNADEENEVDEGEDAPEVEKLAKSEKNAPADDSEDETEEGLAIEDDDADEEVEEKSVKKKKKQAKSENTEVEKPAKKKAAVSKKDKTPRDWMNNRIDSDAAKINKILSGKTPLKAEVIVEKTGAHIKTVYNQVWVMMHKGLVTKGDDGYTLTKKGVEKKSA